jgi:hypothetical protein
LVALDDYWFVEKDKSPLEPFRYGSYYFWDMNSGIDQYKLATIANITSQDSGAAFQQFMYESILKKASGNSNLKFKVTTDPFPISERQKEREKSFDGVFIVFVMGIAFAMIPTGVIGFIVNEREKCVKH